MNGTTTMWLGMTATFFFTIGMISYNAKHLFKQQRAVQGVVLALDNIRYILLFMSFMAIISLVVKKGTIALENYTLSTQEGMVALVFIILFAILLSVAIAGTLLWTERAIGEGGLNRKKYIAVILAFTCVALLDTSFMSTQYASISKELESKKIKALDTVDKTENTDNALIVDTKRDITLSRQQELKDISAEIANIDTLTIRPTKRMRALQTQIESYEKRGKACPKTKAKLAALTENIRERKLEKLKATRSTLQVKLLSIAKDFESTATTIKEEKNKAIDKIKKESKSNQFNATLLVFLGMLLAISLSVIRSILIEDEEVESKEETVSETSFDDKRYYIFEAMKQRATDMKMDAVGGIENLNFPRDKMRDKAIYLAQRDRKILQIGKDTVIKLINDLKRKDGDLDRWLRNTSWNQFDSMDSSYYDDLEEGISTN